MDNDIAKIHNHPAIPGKALLLSPLFMFGAHVFDGSLGESVDHAVTGAAGDDEIISKRNDVF